MTSRRSASWRVRARGLAAAGLLAITLPAAPAAAEQQPTDAQVIQARERVQALRTEEQRQAHGVDAATAALEAAANDSALALETYRAAAEARRAALADLVRRETALAEAQNAVADRRASLARWVREAYVDGGTLGTSPGVYTLLAGGSTNDVATRRTWLQRAGRTRAEVLERLGEALEQRRLATDEATRAARAAEAAAVQADSARAARDLVLEAQRRRLAEVRAALGTARRTADDAERAASALETARLAAGALWPSGGGVTGGVNRVTGPVGDCAGGDVSAYGNGRIPPSALCPLSGTTGDLLRADAAYAFNRLTAAFGVRFGRPLCVTDSYRSYDEQIRARAAKGRWAAVPGRSNHGWGTAVDLCGGVERFDSPEHGWMRVNAPLFGWFHPAWARRDGTLPEPWHWEFSG